MGTSAKSATAFTVRWAAPATLQGKLTKYTVQVSGNGYSKTFTVAGDVLQQAVNGLKADSSYTVVVAAYATSLDGSASRSAKRTATLSTVKPITQTDIDRVIADTNAYQAQVGIPPLIRAVLSRL